MFEEVHRHIIYEKEAEFNKLEARFIELNHLGHIIKSNKVTKNQKKIIKNEKNKQKLLKKIRKWLVQDSAAPQESFEIWHEHSKSSVDKFDLNGLQVEILEEIKKLENEHTEDDSADLPNNNSLDEEEYGHIANEAERDEQRERDRQQREKEISEGKAFEVKLKELTNGNDSSSWTKVNHFIRSRGLEMLPVHNTESNEIPYRLFPAATVQHVNNLTTLLHINIMKKNWNLAYSIFCVIIRIPHVDIRSLWPLGIEIIIGKQGESLDGSKSTIFKDEKFFDWLLSFYAYTGIPYRPTSAQQRKSNSAINWRSGSKTYSPLFAITSLWNLMCNKNYFKLNERLEEFLLQPPYTSDGIFYFFKILYLLGQNSRLATKFMNHGKLFDVNDDEQEEIEDAKFNIDPLDTNSKSSISKLYLSNQKSITQLLETCDQLGLEYPKSSVISQMKRLLKKIGIEDGGDNGSESESDSDNQESAYMTANSFAINKSVNDEDEAHDLLEFSDDPGNEDNEDERDEITDRQIMPKDIELMDFDFDFE